MHLPAISDTSTLSTCCDPLNVKVGVYAAAVILVALAVIFGALVLLTQHCSLHLGPLDGTMKKFIEFLGQYSFVPLAASSGIWSILVGVGICKGCSTQSLPEDFSETRDPTEDAPTFQIPITIDYAEGGPISLPLTLVYTTADRAKYLSITKHAQEGKIEEAWEQYTGEPDSYISQKPLYLPPEELLDAIITHWLSTGKKIGTRVSPDFLVACAVQYPQFCNRCLVEDQLWSLFNGYQEYLADIATAHPSFGVQVMISARGLDITDHHRMEIFGASYKNLFPLIAANGLDDEKMKFLAKFLLCHERAIDKTDFDKIQEITQALSDQKNTHELESDEYKNDFLHVALMDLVEGKLYFQGVYGKASATSLAPPIEMDVVDQVFLSSWIQEIARKISLATEEESIRKGLLYLSLIQETSPTYADAQMALGHIWMDLENFSEAGECFLGVAKLENECEPDATALAALCLLAYSDTLSTDLLRVDMENFNGRTLTMKEIKSFTLETLLNKIATLKVLYRRAI